MTVPPATASQRLIVLQKTLYASRNPTRRYLHCARRDWVRAQIGRLGHQSDIATALEVGPGSGVYLPDLTNAAQRVIAIDIEPTYLQAAKNLLDAKALEARIDCVQGDLRDGPLVDASIDLLLCSEVIEHVADSASLLDAMAAVLAPGGKLILTTPQPYSPVEILGKIAFFPGVVHLLRWIYGEPIEPTGHINLLTRKELEAQCAGAGLRVLEREVLGFYLPVIGEFAGQTGQKLLATMEQVLRGTWMEGLLWTQCYVLERANQLDAAQDQLADL
ncbi:methyltransferase domain-containing protein [Congregibacter variabilis]|uniref:Methyltransferase domain-containing protein n=1 Tax=Congregibacter variabilis TaxID=3081200 RepID=A0ABZ0HZQ4_9GAMM|nr:methyltransferase domain-containing protein [Congregibacter sp. IMCC43200]